MVWIHAILFLLTCRKSANFYFVKIASFTVLLLEKHVQRALLKQ